MIRTAIVVGSTRPGRKAESVARWVLEHAQPRPDATFEILDIAQFDLPLLDEPVPAMAADYRQPHTLAWAAAVASFDAYVLVTPEYNHSSSAALKNAIDYLYAEWNDKAAGLVSYGVDGGIRAGEQLRLVMSEMQVATVRSQVTLSFPTDFRDWSELAPGDGQQERLTSMLDQLVGWGEALKALRESRVA